MHTKRQIEIILKETLDERWKAWFESLALDSLPNGATRISGEVSDQAELHGCLERIRDLNLTLISVIVEEL